MNSALYSKRLCKGFGIAQGVYQVQTRIGYLIAVGHHLTPKKKEMLVDYI